MSKTTTSTDTPADETPADETPVEETPADETPDDSTDKPEGGKPDEDESDTPDGEDDEDEDDEDDRLDLDGAKKALAKVRKSEAKYRTKNRDLLAQLEGAKTPEQIEEIVAAAKKDAADEARALLVENVALKAELPEALWDRLKGDTREELEADAKALAAIVPTTPADDPDLKGGLTPEEEPGDDVAAMRKVMQDQRRRRR